MDLPNEPRALRGKSEVETAKAATETKEERTLRLRCKKYGITPAIYNALGERQGWRCGACGRHQHEFSVSLNIDHEHFKVVAALTEKELWPKEKWIASAIFKDGRQFVVFERTRIKAIAAAKKFAMPHSIRGLLCPGRYTGCNRLMGKIDRIEWLEKGVVPYLRKPPASYIIGEHCWGRTSENDDMSGTSRCLCGESGSAPQVEEHIQQAKNLLDSAGIIVLKYQLQEHKNGDPSKPFVFRGEFRRV